LRHALLDEVADDDEQHQVAYARDFGATPDGRKQYVEAFFRNLDWDHVNRQLAQAESSRRGAHAVGAEPKG
jgi:hypothetical protein